MRVKITEIHPMDAYYGSDFGSETGSIDPGEIRPSAMGRDFMTFHFRPEHPIQNRGIIFFAAAKFKEEP